MALFGSQAAATNTTGDISKDVEVVQQQMPEDSISDLKFSPTHDLLAVASWDGKVYVYEVANGQATLKWRFPCKGPVLSVAWSTVSALLF